MQGRTAPCARAARASKEDTHEVEWGNTVLPSGVVHVQARQGVRVAMRSSAHVHACTHVNSIHLYTHSSGAAPSTSYAKAMHNLYKNVVASSFRIL
eukprot:15259417-Alexandrium_andersonii.AAC.1